MAQPSKGFARRSGGQEQRDKVAATKEKQRDDFKALQRWSDAQGPNVSAALREFLPPGAELQQFSVPARNFLAATLNLPISLLAQALLARKECFESCFCRLFGATLDPSQSFESFDII
jgi:hypothetical protein